MRATPERWWSVPNVLLNRIPDSFELWDLPDCGEVRAALPDDGKPDGWVSAHASMFWSVDDRGTVFAPKAFRKSLADRAGRLPLFWMHDPAQMIGVVDTANEDRAGLVYEGRITKPDGDGVGAQTMANLRASNGHVGQSFGFDRLRDRQANDEDPIDLSTANPGTRKSDVRVITETKLYEFTFLPWTYASNPKAGPDAWRSMATNRTFDSLLNAIRDGSLSDEERSRLLQIVAAYQERAAAGFDHGTRDDEARPNDRRSDVALALARAAQLRIAA
jgi:HK97 family phage prohead protease